MKIKTKDKKQKDEAESIKLGIIALMFGGIGGFIFSSLMKLFRNERRESNLKISLKIGKENSSDIENELKIGLTLGGIIGALILLFLFGQDYSFVFILLFLWIVFVFILLPKFYKKDENTREKNKNTLDSNFTFAT